MASAPVRRLASAKPTGLPSCSATNATSEARISATSASSLSWSAGPRGSAAGPRGRTPATSRPRPRSPRGRPAARWSCPGRRSPRHSRAREQEVRREVLEGREPLAERAHLRRWRAPGRRRRTRRPPSARRGRPPARRPAGRGDGRGTSPRSSARARAARSASRRRRRRERGQRVEVEVGAGERDDVLGLAPREPERRVLGGSDAATRSRDGNSQATSWRTPKRSTKRPRIAAAARSEICCVVIATTSASNPLTCSVGRKPGIAATIRPRTGSPAAQARNAARSKGTPRRYSTSAAALAIVGSTGRLLHGLDPDSRPATTRWRPPSWSTVAPSVPKSRNRAVETSKSYAGESGGARRRHRSRDGRPLLPDPAVRERR